MCGDLDLLTVAHHDCNVRGHRDQLSRALHGSLFIVPGFECVTDREEERHGGSFQKLPMSVAPIAAIDTSRSILMNFTSSARTAFTTIPYPATIAAASMNAFARVNT